MAEIAGLMAVSEANVATFLVGGLRNGDTSEEIDVSRFPERTIQVEGNFGSGGSLTVEGSNDNINWRTLTDDFGNDLTFTAEDIKNVRQSTKYIRFDVTAGDTTTSLIVRGQAT